MPNIAEAFDEDGTQLFVGDKVECFPYGKVWTISRIIGSDTVEFKEHLGGSNWYTRSKGWFKLKSRANADNSGQTTGDDPVVTIEAIADKIIALINSQPRSPRKDEIIAAIREAIK